MRQYCILHDSWIRHIFSSINILQDLLRNMNILHFPMAFYLALFNILTFLKSCKNNMIQSNLKQTTTHVHHCVHEEDYTIANSKSFGAKKSAHLTLLSHIYTLGNTIHTWLDIWFSWIFNLLAQHHHSRFSAYLFPRLMLCCISPWMKLAAMICDSKEQYECYDCVLYLTDHVGASGWLAASLLFCRSLNCASHSSTSFSRIAA